MNIYKNKFGTISILFIALVLFLQTSCKKDADKLVETENGPVLLESAFGCTDYVSHDMFDLNETHVEQSYR